MELNHLLEKLNGVKKTSSGHIARCPAHEDSTASLCVAIGAAGKLLVKCQAGCTPDAVVSSLGLKISDLFPKAPTTTPKAKSSIVATYDYVDENGKLLFQVCRMQPKDFRQRQPDSSAIDGWNWKTAGVRRVLFRLPELTAAIQKGETVFVAEGEKDVLALVSNGFAATCNAGGAGKWNESYSAPLKNADVVVIPDKDEPGKKHAALVCSKLRGVAKSIKLLELPDVSGKAVKDAHDFFAHGGTAVELRELAGKSAVVDAAPAAGQPPTIAAILPARTSGAARQI
jgi:putative DNA primase/helicase